MNTVPLPSSSAAQGTFCDSDTRIGQHQRLETLGLLASGVAHDFNNLLTAVMGHAALAEALLPRDHPARVELARVQGIAGRAAALARRMLNFGRAGATHRTPVDIVAVVEESLPLLRSGLPRRVELRPRFGVTKGLVLADASELQQVLFTLGIGAGQAIGPDDGSIEVTIERVAGGPPPVVQVGQLGRGPHFCMSISNTGRADGARRDGTPAPAGSEAARAILRSIVLQLEGGFSIQAVPGGGSMVKVYLPEAAPARVVRTTAPKRAGAGAAPAHIAIIDDEETVVRLASQALEFSGYRATALPSPEECLERVARQPAEFDLIITDQRMPSMSGIDLARALRVAGHQTPVLITSGSIAAVTLPELQAVEPARFIGKPFTLVDLLSAVQELIVTPRAKAQ